MTTSMAQRTSKSKVYPSTSDPCQHDGATSSSRQQPEPILEEKKADSSCTTWEDKWQELVIEAKLLEQACMEDYSKISNLEDFKDDTNEDPMGNSLGLFGWMDECLWGGLAQLRSEVRELSKDSDKASDGDIKCKLEEFQAQQEHLAAALGVAATELERNLEPISRQSSAWLMETSILRSPGCGSVHSPPWRGVRGGDGGSYSTGRLAATAAAGSPSLCRSASSGKVEHGGGVENDTVISDVREKLFALDEEVKQAGGPTGGWGEVAHDIFLTTFRLFRRRSSELLFRSLAKRLPKVSQAGIAAHVQWFVDFEKHQSAKRQLLATWRQRVAELEQKAVERQLMTSGEEARRKEGVKRSRSADQQRTLKKWRQKQAKLKEQAVASERRMKSEKAQLEGELRRRQQKDELKKEKALAEFRQQRKAASEAAEKKAASSERSHVPSPEVKQHIARQHSEMLKSLGEKSKDVRQAYQRSHSQPTLQKNPAYQHVQSKWYASTACHRQRFATQQLPQEYPNEPEPEAAASGSRREAFEAEMYKTSLQSSWRHAERNQSAAADLHKKANDCVLAPDCTFEAVD